MDGHAARQALPKSFGATAGHAVQSVAVPPLQAAHEPSQLSHVDVPLLVSSYIPTGHVATHVVPCLMGVLPAHVAQSLAVPPEHVLQLA